MQSKILIIISLVLLLSFSQAFAEVFHWVDDRGNLQFAKHMGGIPEKYRSKADTQQKVILGSTQAEVTEIFKQWRKINGFQTNARAAIAKFQNEDLIAMIFFSSQGTAEGVAFLSMHVEDSKCRTSYILENRETLVSWATGEKTTKVEFEQSRSKYPREMYIGDVPR